MFTVQNDIFLKEALSTWNFTNRRGLSVVFTLNKAFSTKLVRTVTLPARAVVIVTR